VTGRRGRECRKLLDDLKESILASEGGSSKTQLCGQLVLEDVLEDALDLS
jgi:hypothetical protein